MSSFEKKPYYEESIWVSSSAYNAGFGVKLFIDGGIRSVEALASLNKRLDQPFGSVPLAVRALTFALHQEGYPVESRHGNDGGWCVINESKFDADLHYRVLPRADMPASRTFPSSGPDF